MANLACPNVIAGCLVSAEEPGANISAELPDGSLPPPPPPDPEPEPPPAFSPATLTGLFAWWKADSLELNDTDPVDSWLDETSNDNDLVQANPANQPAYVASELDGMPAVDCDGAGDSMTFTEHTFAGDFTVIAVLSRALGDGCVLSNSAVNRQVRSLGGDNARISLYDGSSNYQSDQLIGVIGSDPRVIVWQRSANDYLFYGNKTSLGVQAMAGGNNRWDMFANSGTAGLDLEDPVCELCIYEAALTQGEIEQLYDEYWKLRYPSLP